MALYITVGPAYGREYKTAKEVKSSWDAGHDFIILDTRHPNCGSYINKEDAQSAKGAEKPTAVNIRYDGYDGMRKIAVMKIK